MGRIMGIDRGKKRTGIAISDELGLTARPLCVIEVRGRSAVIREIMGIIREHGVEEVVVGMPLNLDGTMSVRGRDAERFAEALRKASGLPVHCWDERYSTTAVTRALIEEDVSRAKRREVVDKNAAAYILEGYLEKRRGS